MRAGVSGGNEDVGRRTAYPPQCSAVSRDKRKASILSVSTSAAASNCAASMASSAASSSLVFANITSHRAALIAWSRWTVSVQASPREPVLADVVLAGST